MSSLTLLTLRFHPFQFQFRQANFVKNPIIKTANLKSKYYKNTNTAAFGSLRFSFILWQLSKFLLIALSDCRGVVLSVCWVVELSTWSSCSRSHSRNNSRQGGNKINGSTFSFTRRNQARPTDQLPRMLRIYIYTFHTTKKKIKKWQFGKVDAMALVIYQKTKE